MHSGYYMAMILFILSHSYPQLSLTTSPYGASFTFTFHEKSFKTERSLTYPISITIYNYHRGTFCFISLHLSADHLPPAIRHFNQPEHCGSTSFHIRRYIFRLYRCFIMAADDDMPEKPVIAM